ncbi:hypothetical protein [Microbacterium cremeum]|uniref:hypothetical protein n=1 Tax=Microbacterium cremeum TaxID=2782169 RepID=UPI001888D444|nr:hypothetical protein [Microbacterium cremeum]
MSTAAHAHDGRRGSWIARRWPSLAGLAFGGALAVAYWVGFSSTAQAGQVLTAAGFVYLGSAALGSRRAAWPLFALTFVVIGVGFAVPAFDPGWTIVGAAVVIAVIGLVRGAIRPGWGLPLQALAMAAIVLVALGVALVSGRVAGLLVGVGLLAHAAWDVYHLRTQRVVASSMAEFCCVLDTVLAVTLIVVSLSR